MRVIYPEQYDGYGDEHRRYARTARMDYEGRRPQMRHPNYETMPRARRGRDSKGRYTSAYDGYNDVSEWYASYPFVEGDRRVIGFTGAMDGMQLRSRPEMGGHSWAGETEDFTMEDAKEWVMSMHGGGGKESGEHWSFDQTTNLLHQRGYKHDPAEWYAIMHTVYYDFCGVAKKYGLNKNDEFYADLAHAWLEDEDAVDNKAAVYYDCMVE